MWNKIKPYILPYSIAIAIPLAVGTLSAFMTKDNMDIYSQIIKPPLAPPGWLFPIVWTVLYVLMGVGAAMIYMKQYEEKENVRKALGYYAMSLVVNFGWSIIFFNMRVFALAFIWLILLVYLIVRYIIIYFKIDRIAAYLQIPYAVWVIFAGYLNFAIAVLN